MKLQVGQYAKEEKEENQLCPLAAGDEDDRPDIRFRIILPNGSSIDVCEAHYYQYYTENPEGGTQKNGVQK